jgi:Fe2+ transport system protein FeoA
MAGASYERYRLSDFRGRHAEIVHFDLPESEARRLKCLGVFEGQSIRLEKAGCPMIFTAAGSRVAIAGEIASRIVVRVPVNRAA